MIQVDCPDLEATAHLAAALGRTAPAGGFLALDGDLGAGKTTFTRYFAAALGVPGRVTSPTFALAHVHEGGRLRLAHADWYRLAAASEVELLELGSAEDGVVVVEWAGRFPTAWPDEHLALHLEIGDAEARRATLRARGARHAAWLARAFA